ncbi:MAG: hypothetical protein MUC32_04275, partial [Burkholderiaceae bacterium]|nr:hypothetical protein [Burkholderiaceae bacterium]
MVNEVEPGGARRAGAGLSASQPAVSSISVLNQVPMSWKLSVVIDADSVAVAGTPSIVVRPPFVAIFILRSAGSYWYTAVSHDAVLAV